MALAREVVARLLTPQRVGLVAAAQVLSSQRGLVQVQQALRGKALLAGKDIAAVSMLASKLAAVAAEPAQSVLTGSPVGVMAVLVLRPPLQERP